MISPMIFPLKRGIPQPPMFLIAGRVVYVLYLAHGSFVGKNIKPHTDQVGKKPVDTWIEPSDNRICKPQKNQQYSIGAWQMIL